jgi:hypothetical protein
MNSRVQKGAQKIMVHTPNATSSTTTDRVGGTLRRWKKKEKSDDMHRVNKKEICITHPVKKNPRQLPFATRSGVQTYL